MSQSLPTPDPPPMDARTLFRIMEIPAMHEPDWSAAELAEIWPHQLRAPLAPDLERIIPGSAERIEQMSAGIFPPIVTFGDLLSHPNPPLELLTLVKEFGKISPDHPEHPIPRDIAAVIYLAAIVVAQRRWEKRITNLADDKRSESVRWALAQPWLDHATRSLFLPGQSQ